MCLKLLCLVRNLKVRSSPVLLSALRTGLPEELSRVCVTVYLYPWPAQLLLVVTVLLCILSQGFSGFLCAILAQFSGYNTTAVETELLSEAQRESCCCWLADALDNLTWIQSHIYRLHFPQCCLLSVRTSPQRGFSAGLGHADIVFSGVCPLWYCN